jgi:hypothetical protein
VDARSLARRVLSLAPVLGLVGRPGDRAAGITAVVRVRGEEAWLELALRSLADFADEVLVLDNGAAEGARAAIARAAPVLGARLVQLECPELDLFDLSNLGLARARYRFVVRWDADFVGHTDGPGDLRHLRRYLLGLDPRRYFLVALPAAEVAGDLHHQFPDRRIRHDGQAHTASRAARFVRVTRRTSTDALDVADRALRARAELSLAFESLAVPPYYAVLRWPAISYFHVHVKPAHHLLLRHFWLEWLAEHDGVRHPTLERYALAQARERWGIADPDAAAAHLVRRLAEGLVPFDAGVCGPYPALLRPHLEHEGDALGAAQRAGRREPA